MPKIRILVVDDAVVFRRVVSDELNALPELEVVGSAANGQIALAKLAQLNPDLVILDYEMPELDGLETLVAIRKTHPRLPVIMFSAHTERGAETTLEALSRGATDYFTKPAGTGGLEEARKVIREKLGPAIVSLCKKGIATNPIILSKPTATPKRPAKVDVVAIGVSTGGPNALQEVFRELPAKLRVPILLVQHMPPMFTKLLAERLSANSKVRVSEPTQGQIVQCGEALIAPGDFHMTVARDGTQVRAVLNQDPPENSCRPAVDTLFRSVAKVYGSGVLAIVMTGMGSDGLRGAEAVRAAGGQILAQDEATSVVWGMPGHVARAGLADRILPLQFIVPEILTRVGSESP